jgi:hypothetical protein
MPTVRSAALPLEDILIPRILTFWLRNYPAAG